MNLKLMKKNYLLGALMSILMALFVLPVNAQVSTIADLYGKYQFTAEMKIVEGMEAYASELSNDCEVVISQDPTYPAKIIGFAGSQDQLNINAISTEKMMIKATNPNNPQLWDGLYLANEKGDYPYGVYDSQLGEWTVESYGPIYFSYDPDTKLITIPDFTVVTCDHANSKSTVVATFSNVKLTLKEAETIEIIDLSGTWNAKPMGTYGSNADSDMPAEYSFVLTKTSDDNKNYDVALTIGDYPVINLTATFDGVELAIHAKDVVVDAATGATIYYNGSTEYDFTFTLASETTLSMSTPLCIALPNPDAGEDEPKFTMEQWYMDGAAKKDVEDAPSAQTWEGVWNVKAGVVAIDGSTTATEFEMVIEKVQNWDGTDLYLITNFLGNDVTGLNYGGITITPSADGKTAEIETGTYLKTIEAGVSYSVLYDMNLSTSPIAVTMNEDGTLSIASFCVCTNSYGGAPADATFVGLYTDATASKNAEEEVEPFEWTGTWTVKATESMSNTPAEFEMVIEKVQNWDGTDLYLITNFLGNDVTGLNYGGITITPSADGKTAEIETGTYLKTIEAGVAYSVLYDMNLSASPITVTVNADGSLSIDNFSVATNGYGGAAADATLTGFYTDVTASKGAEEEEVEPFEWTGTWTVKATESMSNTPAEFEMVIEKVQNWDGTDLYLITNFLGNDVTGLNYGGITITPSADGKTAEIETGTYLKTIEAGVSYSVLYDMNLSTSPITVTVNADGSLSIDNFSVATNGYGSASADATLTGFYTEVTATKGGAEEDAINGVVADEVMKVEYFSLGGAVLDAPAKGINIVRKTLKNGNVVTTKTFVK